MADDPNDYSTVYNTPIPPAQKAAYDAWLAEQSLGPTPAYDYDIQGAYLSGAAKAGNGHLPDRFKKPNHPTFSTQSQYSTPAAAGGTWQRGDDGRWTFTASPVNLRFHEPKALQRYFRDVEPDSTLILAPVEAQRSTP